MSRQTERKIPIKISDVKTMLKKGFTRLEKDDAGKGSIQGHYGLNQSDVKELFRNPQLKGLRTVLPKENPFVIIDDESGEGIGENAIEEVTSNEKVESVDEEEETTTSEHSEEEEEEEKPAPDNSLDWDNVAEDAPELAGKPEERSH